MKIKVCKKTMDVVLLSNHSIIEYEYGVVDELHVVHYMSYSTFFLDYSIYNTGYSSGSDVRITC